MPDDKVGKIVKDLKILPTLPELYIKLRQLLDSDNYTFADIAALIERDVSVSSKVMQLVNSAFFGLRHRVCDIKQGLAFIGMETLKGIVITSDMFSKFSDTEANIFKLKELYFHSFYVSILSRYIASTFAADKKFSDCMSLAGLLHDIGKLVCVMNLRYEYERVFEVKSQTDTPLYEIEEREFGFNHADVGGYLMKLWGFNSDIVTSVASHHNLPSSDSELTCSVVFAANGLANGNGIYSAYAYEYISLEEAGFDETKVSVWNAEALKLKKELPELSI